MFRLGDPPLTRTAARLARMMRWFCIDKAKKRFGYQPLIPLDGALVLDVKDYVRRRNGERGGSGEESR